MTIEYVVALWLGLTSAPCQAKFCTLMQPHEGMRYHILDQHLEACVINHSDKPALMGARVVGDRIQVLMGEGVTPCPGPSS